MLNDIQHLIIGASGPSSTIAGIPCRPLTLQTYALMELTGNELLTAPSTRMADVLGFIYLHSAPQEKVAEATAAYLAGDKARMLKEALNLPSIPLADLADIARQIREMIEQATGSQVVVEGAEVAVGN
jgi:hypothetical protein